MKARNKRLGDDVCALVADRFRRWGFGVRSHEDNPQDAPGDLVVGNGKGVRLYVEVKGFRQGVAFRYRDGAPRRRRYPGRPMLTPARHDWLRERGGVYVFARYRAANGGPPRLYGLRWAPASEIWVPAGVRVHPVPWGDVARFPRLDRRALSWILEEMAAGPAEA